MKSILTFALAGVLMSSTLFAQVYVPRQGDALRYQAKQGRTVQAAETTEVAKADHACCKRQQAANTEGCSHGCCKKGEACTHGCCKKDAKCEDGCKTGCCTKGHVAKNHKPGNTESAKANPKPATADTAEGCGAECCQ
jgi:hypothetical protein